jgi:SARP family transcriptional regulator, regulator of embCAB operon
VISAQVFSQVQVLGPVNLVANCQSIVPQAPRQRQVLALLMMHRCQVVPMRSIIRELWGDEPPMTARTTVQTYVVHLRRLLVEALGVTPGQVAQEVLRTQGSAYVFEFDAAAYDLHHYKCAEARGDQDLAAGNLRGAITAYKKAESIWRGPLLADVDAGQLLAAEAARLEQSRMTVAINRIEASLRLGQHRAVLSELAGLTTANPVDEGIHEKFIVALYRSGHRSRALDAYANLQQNMVNDLGLHPSPALRRLQKAVLDADSALETWRD